ncbi:Helix-turn-helix [Chryseobacterium taichungense]|uniref:Helix-turn-helix n=1 Tax=Chryseobacterium taichungense TaxID=295069 RepID=A0A1H7Y8A6_9FLAO|nr:Helix-turn-helix [Chryseobacterium taichungense]
MGIDQVQYSRIESGKVEPTLSSLDKIAEALGIKLAELLDEEQTLDINSYDKNVIDKVRLLEELDEIEKNPSSILSISPSVKTIKRQSCKRLQGIKQKNLAFARFFLQNCIIFRYK